MRSGLNGSYSTPKNIKRDYAEANHWVPVEENKSGIMVMSTDPERVKNSRMVDNVFPRSKIVYRVTTEKDFKSTLDHLFGADTGGGSLGAESIGDLLSSLDDEEEGALGAGPDLYFTGGWGRDVYRQLYLKGVKQITGLAVRSDDTLLVLDGPSKRLYEVGLQQVVDALNGN